MPITNVDRHLVPDTLTVHRYHGLRKILDLGILSNFDIVLTTYATLAARLSTESPLHEISWFRIVLDEGKTQS
jgi:SWI/SNF-related matrix-associated actin-dependent regulator of chromatin subfamily A3